MKLFTKILLCCCVCIIGAAFPMTRDTTVNYQIAWLERLVNRRGHILTANDRELLINTINAMRELNEFHENMPSLHLGSDSLGFEAQHVQVNVTVQPRFMGITMMDDIVWCFLFIGSVSLCATVMIACALAPLVKLGRIG